MSKDTPWTDINTPTFDLNVRRVVYGGTLPLYWGKDVEGQCVFVIELTGDHTGIFEKNSVLVHGIKTDLRLLSTSDQNAIGLIIKLEKHVDQDLFYNLCNSLIDALSDVSDSTTGISVVLSHIKRWKSFMAGRKANVLTAEEVRGLFCELVFLKDMFRNGIQPGIALNAWQGPEDSHHDFVYSNSAVEIKSLSGKERKSVIISSEDQLEMLHDNLYLKTYRIVETQDLNSSMSLNDLVKKIEFLINEPEDLEMLSSKLSKAGYIELPLYDSPKFTIAGERSYKVDNGFPRLIRSLLPEGVFKVRYEIELEKIKPFVCENEVMWE